MTNLDMVMFLTMFVLWAHASWRWHKSNKACRDLRTEIMVLRHQFETDVDYYERKLNQPPIGEG